MSQSRHRHRAAALAVGLIVGVPLLGAGPAVAGPVVESGRQVTFSGGGLLGVSCAARPDTASLTISAETSLRVVNRTGHRAILLLDGAARGEIPRGSTAEVLFHRGPVSLSLSPQCVLPQQKPVRVQVVPHPPTGAPQGAGPTAPTTPAGEPRPGHQGKPGTGNAGSNHGGPGGRDTGDAGMGRAPSAPDTHRRVHNDVAGRPQGGRPAAPVSPEGEAVREPAGTATPDPAVDELMGDEPSVPETNPVDGAAADAGGEDLAAEPMASVEPITDKGPTGLLAVIAIVCVLGASAGAIRAIFAQRASRASIA